MPDHTAHLHVLFKPNYPGKRHEDDEYATAKVAPPILLLASKYDVSCCKLLLLKIIWLYLSFMSGLSQKK